MPCFEIVWFYCLFLMLWTLFAYSLSFGSLYLPHLFLPAVELILPALVIWLLSWPLRCLSINVLVLLRYCTGHCLLTQWVRRVLRSVSWVQVWECLPCGPTQSHTIHVDILRARVWEDTSSWPATKEACVEMVAPSAWVPEWPGWTGSVPPLHPTNRRHAHVLSEWETEVCSLNPLSF